MTREPSYGATCSRPRAGRGSRRRRSSTQSQSVKTTERGGPHGIDAWKKVNGRKRHILVDTLGLILAVVVHAADIPDPEGAKLVFDSIRGQFSRLKLVWADGIYKRVVDWVAAWRPAKPIRREVVERTEPGFKVLPRRLACPRTRRLEAGTFKSIQPPTPLALQVRTASNSR